MLRERILKNSLLVSWATQMLENPVRSTHCLGRRRFPSRPLLERRNTFKRSICLINSCFVTALDWYSRSLQLQKLTLFVTVYCLLINFANTPAPYLWSSSGFQKQCLRGHTGLISDLLVRKKVEMARYVLKTCLLLTLVGYCLRILRRNADFWSVARGFARSGQGNPDEARAARYILKDYVNAKLLFCHPPPNYPADSFNHETRELALRRTAGKKRAPTTRVTKNADTYTLDHIVSNPSDSPPLPGQSQKSHVLDKQFFDETANLAARPFAKGVGGKTQSISRPILYPHHLSVADDGTPLIANRVPIGTLMVNSGGRTPGKKDHKKVKRTKQRSGKGYD